MEDCLAKAAEGIEFYKAKISFYHSDDRLGSPLEEEQSTIGKAIHWRDSEQTGYFSRDKEFSVEFSIAGRNFAYGKVEYTFMDGRSNLSVQDEVLLERIHDAISSLLDASEKIIFKFDYFSCLRLRLIHWQLDTLI